MKPLFTIPVRLASAGRALYYEANTIYDFRIMISDFKRLRINPKSKIVNLKLFDQSGGICCKYLYGNSQQYYAKKFSHSH